MVREKVCLDEGLRERRVVRDGAVAGEFALVKEGDGEEHGAKNEEGEDAVGAGEEGEVVEKDFNDDDAEKDEGLPAEQRGMAWCCCG